VGGAHGDGGRDARAHTYTLYICVGGTRKAAMAVAGTDIKGIIVAEGGGGGGREEGEEEHVEYGGQGRDKDEARWRWRRRRRGTRRRCKLTVRS
jgi:hypothetical protein